MKKYVLLGLSLMLLCFLTGGIYITTSIQRVTNKLENVISFHQVEFLRQNLEHHIKAVQSDLLLQGSPHTSQFDTSVALIETMEKSAAKCLSCHHSPQVNAQLEALQKRIDQYMKLLSRTLTIRANSSRLENARRQAFDQGQTLLKNVEALSVASADRIAVRIQKIHSDINAAKHALMTSIVLGPIAILLITLFFLRRFTGSVGTLLTASNNLQRGNLDYRVPEEELKNEFRTLAKSFNSMAVSLQEEQKKFESVYKLYQTLFETAGDAIMITGFENGTTGRIVSANQAAADLYGYPIEELLGMDILRLIPDGKEQSFREKVEAALSGGQWTHQRVRRTRKDCTQIRIDLSMGLLQLGNQQYVLSFCRDITEQLQAEEELQRANQMALVGQMAAGLAHEIKNPLAGVKVSLDVLADDLELREEDKDLFARIINEVNRMEKLLKNLLNYARPPQPQFDLADINQVIRNTMKNVEITAAGQENHTIHFHSDLQVDLPQMEVDSGQMQQIFLNILLNAVDAIETEGTISVISRTETGGNIRIQIADTGKGMSEMALGKIFNPFFTTKSKGTGLGLSICKRLVEQHDGTIAVNSQEGQGTTFVMTLPLAQKNQE